MDDWRITEKLTGIDYTKRTCCGFEDASRLFLMIIQNPHLEEATNLRSGKVTPLGLDAPCIDCIYNPKHGYYTATP